MLKPTHMKNFMYVLAAAGCVAFPNFARAEGPFGITMGSDVASFGCVKLLSPGFYRCRSIPKPQSDFVSYTIQYHKSTGICWVKGIGRDVQTTRSGEPIQAIADDIAKRISQLYGPAKKVDYLLTTSHWSGREYWMMSMQQGERFYSYTWDDAGMKNQIDRIYVTINTRTLNISYVIAEFQFANWRECEKRIKGESSDLP